VRDITSKKRSPGDRIFFTRRGEAMKSHLRKEEEGRFFVEGCSSSLFAWRGEKKTKNRVTLTHLEKFGFRKGAIGGK